jgi:hypothetical protein
MKKNNINARVSICIFYTVSQPVQPFNITDMPPNWNWIGAGNVEPSYNTKSGINIFEPSSKYKQEEQFMGPEETREEAKQILDKQLRILTEAGILQFYHIQNNYLPVPI